MVILEKVFLKTTCDIKQGDEIFVSYGLNYWRLFVQNQKDDWTITNKNHRSHEWKQISIHPNFESTTRKQTRKKKEWNTCFNDKPESDPSQKKQKKNTHT